MRRDGSRVRPVVLGGGSGPSCHAIYGGAAAYSSFSSPAWSPDGATLAVVGNNDWPIGSFYPPGLKQTSQHDPIDLLLVDLEGRVVRKLAERALSPSWRLVR
jgi:hypothetical protein